MIIPSTHEQIKWMLHNFIKYYKAKAEHENTNPTVGPIYCRRTTERNYITTFETRSRGRIAKKQLETSFFLEAQYFLSHRGLPPKNP